MRSKIAFLTVFLLLTFFCDASVGNTSTAALEALVQRQLPFHADSFVFHLDPQVQIDMKTHSALDTFTLFDGGDGKVHIECSTKSACARGLYTYNPPFNCVLIIDTLRKSEKWMFIGLEVNWVRYQSNYLL